MAKTAKSDSVKGLKKIYLIKVEPEANNNKFYYMTELGDGTFKAEYGRVGSDPDVKIYPMSMWDKKYKEKLSSRKGYSDVTHLYLEEVKTADEKTTITEITNKVVANLVKQLRGYARISTEENYLISSEKVTQTMIDEAQALVDEITGIIKMDQPVEPINKLLVELFKIIPRRMRNVKDYLFEGGPILDTRDELNAAQRLIAKEQDTLDVMAGQVSTQNKLDIKTATPSALNILESMGLIVEEVEENEIPLIKKLMQDNKHQFKRAFRVINKRTQDRFDKHLKKVDNKKIELFWHGSRNENWWSILDKGLMLRPANAVRTGAMFGEGIYFASLFRKSYGYTSGRGSYWAKGNENSAFLALKAVHVGEQLKIEKHQSWCYDLSLSNLKKRGNYDSLWAVGGADLINDEFVVYTEPQCTVTYLVEVSSN